jgi:predicted transposase YdaD
VSEETEFIPVREFPDRGTRWLLESPSNVREVVRLVAADLVEQLDFSRLQQVRTTFVADTLRKQESDLVFLVPWRETEDEVVSEVLVYILLEHQSTPDPAIGFRLLYYMVLIWDRQRQEWENQQVSVSRWRFRPVIPVVFYTGAAHWQGPFSVADLMEVPQALRRFVPYHDTLLLNLKGMAPEELVTVGHPLGWVLRVMQQEGASREALAVALREAMAGLDRLPSGEQAAWRQAAYYLLLLIYHRRERQEWEALAQVVLEPVREHVRREEIEQMGKTIAEELIDEGKELGLQQGKELGLQQGKELGLQQGKELGLQQGILQAKQEDLLRLLRAKFGSLPPAVVEQIEALGDVTRLDALLERVLTAHSLEEMNLG